MNVLNLVKLILNKLYEMSIEHYNNTISISNKLLISLANGINKLESTPKDIKLETSEGLRKSIVLALKN